MKIIKCVLLCIAVCSLTNCASSYKTIDPESVNYNSRETTSNEVKLEYKYERLRKKYAKKSDKKGVKMVALKITNNSGSPLTFGKDLLLVYDNGNPIPVMDNQSVYNVLKQSPATYLLYLLLTPLNFYTYETNSNGVEETSSSFPIGLILGPGITLTNMVVASSANKQFKTELETYDLFNTVIPDGETVYGLIGIRTYTYESLNLKVNIP
ncbi:hypothetical protein [Psychroflexus tropicus]|uniref:hypothetical protein n=1 Tax=Psychroflexus tropicus TaxID=197345 RepID=UPI00038048F1|nr:hypothetical protein [Psychroflexus tropicus]